MLLTCVMDFEKVRDTWVTLNVDPEESVWQREMEGICSEQERTVTGRG